MDATGVSSLVDSLWLRVDGQLASVKTAVDDERRRKKREEEEEKKRKKREAVERENIKKVELEMENQKKKREEEEREKEAKEKQRGMRSELEAKRVEEAAAAASAATAPAAATAAASTNDLLVASQVEIERQLLLEAKEEAVKMQKVEQERRDRELALRLARDEEEVDDMMIMGGLKRGSQVGFGIFLGFNSLFNRVS